MPDAMAVLRELPVAVLCSAHPKVQAFGPAIRPASPEARLFGTARTAMTKPGENAAIHRAVHAAVRGDVLVVSTGGDLNHGMFGDILAAASLRRGIGGLVIDGTVRDLGEVARLGFPVFCRGANPMSSRKDEPGQIDTVVTCGDARVCPGDLISGDRDGVVVIPQAFVEVLAHRAEAVMAREREIRQLLASGKTTCEIFDIAV